MSGGGEGGKRGKKGRGNKEPVVCSRRASMALWSPHMLSSSSVPVPSQRVTLTGRGTLQCPTVPPDDTGVREFLDYPTVEVLFSRISGVPEQPP